MTSTTRRAAIGAFAAAAFVPAGALASSQADPVFAAIATWREADRAHSEEYDQNGWGGRASETSCAYHAAAMAMATTMPTTVLGMAALMEITAHDIEIGDAAWQPVAFWTVAKALRAIAGGEALYEPESDDEEAIAQEPRTGSIVLDHFKTQAPAPHITVTPYHDGNGWCIRATADGHEPLLFGGYAIDEQTSHWAAEQVGTSLGCAVTPLRARP